MTLTLTDLKRPGASLHDVLDGLARLIVENIGRLPDDAVVRIHDIRVSTKKIRSLLRLAASEISVEDRAALVACLQAIKNTFSDSRDEDVMRETLRQILPGKRATEMAEKLGLVPSENTSPLPTASASASAAQLSSLLAALNLNGLTPEHLAENAASSYRRARRIMSQCKKSRDDDAMHEWRKRVKDVCYHAMAFSAVPPMEEFARPLDALAESLGDYHDLALLGVRAADHKTIAARVNSAKGKVGKRCFNAAKPLFHSPAGKFAKELARLLRQV